MTVRERRLHSQLLAGAPATDVLSVVERVVGVQAQSWPAARLAVRARSSALTAADVDAALTSGRLARTWLMRGTLHLVAAADLGWLTSLFGPINRAAGERRRFELGVSDDVAARALAELPGILAGAGPMERGRLVAQLARRGVRVDPSGQAPAHLVAYAAAAGVVCRGPEVGGKPTVILASELEVSSPRAFTGDAALAELARRYLVGHGPASADDLAAWSGLPVTLARRALSLGAPAAVPVSSGAASPLSSGAASARLLGAFDTLLLGYRDRSFVLDAERAGLVNRGGGMIAATMLVDGRVAGVWQRSGRKVVLQPFPGLDRDPARGAAPGPGAARSPDRGPTLGPDRGPALGPDRGPNRGPALGPARGPALGSAPGPALGPARRPARRPARGAARGPARRLGLGSAGLVSGAREALEAEVTDLSRFLGERLVPVWEGV